MKPLTALIVVTHNDLRMLDSCLKSISHSAKYAHVKTEYIVVANGCFLAQNKYRAKKVKIIHIYKNIGFGQAVNEGMRIVKTEWVIIASPDTITTQNCIKILLKHVNEAKLAIIAPQILRTDKTHQETIVPIPSLWQIAIEQSFLYRAVPKLFKSSLSDKKLYTKYGYVEGVAAVWWFIQTDVFKRMHGFDNRFFLYFEDVDICKRLKDLGYLIGFEPEAIVDHIPHQSTGGMTAGNLYVKSFEKFLDKYYGGLYSEICMLLFRTGTILRWTYWYFRMKSTQKSEIKSIATQKIKFFKEVLEARG